MTKLNASPDSFEPSHPFPNIEQDFRQALSLQLPGGYKFRLFQLGERGNSLNPELIEEAVTGIADLVEGFGSYDLLLTTEPGGARWSRVMQQQLQHPMLVATTDSLPYLRQLRLDLEEVMGKSKVLYAPLVEPGSQVVIFEDIISSGTTIEALTNHVRSSGGQIVGAAAFIDKCGLGSHLSAGLGFPVQALVQPVQQ